MTWSSPLRVGLIVEQLWQPVPGGSGTYIVELGDVLAARRDEVTAFGLAARHTQGLDDSWRTALPVRYSRLPRRALYAGWQWLSRPLAERDAGPMDVCHATTWAVPPTRAALVVTVHDLAFLDRPEVFTRHGNAYFRRALDHVRARADAVVVPSEATANQCRDAGITNDRIHVVPHGVTVPRPPREDIEATQQRLGVTAPYLMWAGTVEPRKNVPNLLAAYDLLARDSDVPDLVLVGPAGWGPEPQVPAAVRHRVHRTGALPRADLHALMAGATAFVFPSWSEGFGMPVLEAMAHGVPVVTSADTACAEVAGSTGYLVDPADADSIAGGCERHLPRRQALRASQGRTRAAGFTWQAAADATITAYRAAIARRRG